LLYYGDFRKLIHHKILLGGGLKRGGIHLHDERTEVEDINAVREHMLLRLEQMRQNGVELFVDGRAVLPAEAVTKAVRENSPYMADYVLDASGSIEQVRFDKVTRR
jgi:hypothetical protein